MVCQNLLFFLACFQYYKCAFFENQKYFESAFILFCVQGTLEIIADESLSVKRNTLEYWETSYSYMLALLLTSLVFQLKLSSASSDLLHQYYSPVFQHTVLLAASFEDHRMPFRLTDGRMSGQYFCNILFKYFLATHPEIKWK